MSNKENNISVKDLEHQRKLFEYFSSSHWPVLQEELREYKADLTGYMAALDVSKEADKIEHIRSKAKMELLDIWLKLPEANKTLIEQIKDFFIVPFPLK